MASGKAVQSLVQCVSALVVVSLSFACGLAQAVELGTPFSDGAVFQRGVGVPVWGRATPGNVVTVSFAGQERTAKAGADGSWRVLLSPMDASRDGRTLVATESVPGWLFDTTVDVSEAKDVLVGEVWFASGQSNMNCPVWGGNPRFRQGNGAVLREITNLERVRYVKNPRVWSVSPRRIEAQWRSMTPDNLRKHPLSALALLFARDLALALDVPVGIVDSSWGGTGISAWTPRCGYEGCDPLLKDIASMPVGETFDPANKIGGINSAVQQPTVLFNGLVASWAPMAMRGFIWYQGCHDNGDTPELYLAKLRALYAGWSRAFENPSLRMYLVQLAPYRTSWMNICLAQTEFAASEPNAEVAVAADQGNFDDIHPNDKETIAHRLALHALRRDYGFGAAESRSPVFRSADFRVGGAVLHFDNVRSWYVYSPDRSHSAPFELAGTDGVWRPARIANFARRDDRKTGKPTEAYELAGPEVVLSCDGMRERPVKVRYMGASRTSGTLYNEMSLPLGPFDSDAVVALRKNESRTNDRKDEMQ